jgi:flagellar basal body-associated protein FliL
MAFGESDEAAPRGERGRLNLVIMSVLLVAVLALGLYMPTMLNDALNTIAQLFLGGNQ